MSLTVGNQQKVKKRLNILKKGFTKVSPFFCDQFFSLGVSSCRSRTGGRANIPIFCCTKGFPFISLTLPSVIRLTALCSSKMHLLTSLNCGLRERQPTIQEMKPSINENDICGLRLSKSEVQNYHSRTTFEYPIPSDVNTFAT